MGAVQFIENLDRTSLSISDEEFEVNVEAAVSAIAEKHQASEALPPSPPPQAQLSEKSALNRPELTQRRSGDGESSTPRKSTSSYETDSGDGIDEKAAMSGLLRTIQRPLTSIGRIFSEEAAPSQSGPARTPLPGNTPRLSPAPATDADRARSPLRAATAGGEDRSRSRLNAEDAAARQASAEAAEARRIQRAEHANVVETLAGMFPDLDREIISDVVTQKNGRLVYSLHIDPFNFAKIARVALAVDACLALSS
jgi:Rab5 GDP/GTP exchange factor